MMRFFALGLAVALALGMAPAQSRTFVYKDTPHRPLQLVVDYPDHWRATDRRPAIVFFFGSGWRDGNLNQFERQAEYFSRRGMVVVRPDYRFWTQDHVEPQDAIEDGRAAVEWVFGHARELGVDRSRVVVAGGSTGGQIAACLVQCQDPPLRPAALILFNPTLDVAEVIQQPRNPNAPFQGFTRLRADTALQERITPLLHVKRSDPPTLVLTGTLDKLFASSREYVGLLREAGVRAELYSAQGASHGFFNVEPWRERTIRRADEFLASLGFLKGHPAPSSERGADRLAADHPIVRQLLTSLDETETKVLLALEEMPAESYDFRSTPLEPSFRRLALDLAAVVNDQLCSAIVRIEEPDRDNLPPNSTKQAIIDRVKSTFDFCRDSFTKIDAVSLNDSVSVDLRNERLGPPPPISRVSALLALIQQWTSAYTRLAEDVRLNGRIPPVPCTGKIDKNCAQGENRCYALRPASAATTEFVLDDANHLVTSDSRGPYRLGASNVIATVAGRALLLALGRPRPGIPARSIRIDLSQPTAGSVAKPLGVVVDTVDLEVGAQMQMDPDGRAHTVDEIPVGASVKAAQANVQFHIGGVVHILQFGPQAAGHCFSDGTRIDGSSTSQAIITRLDSNTWSVDLPAGSVGRLYDVHLGYPHAIDRGLYYSSMHFVVLK